MEESLPINATISHYRVLEKLGAGGMGEVYLAEDTQLDRKVAIKFLPPESTADQQAKKRLAREARAAAKLDHPNICTIHEVGEEEGRSFIVMQYVEGVTLASRLQRKPLEIVEALDIAVHVADALAEAHSHGIIHRDIKPQNVMLTARGQVKVLDFGLAKVVQQRSFADSGAETESLLTERGMIMGTVPYMSPEQVRGETLDARSDIFSFGAVLYEMVSGRQLFAAESLAGTISAILTTEPPPLKRYVDVPEQLQRIVQKCLEKNRERRYQTMRDLVIDLENSHRECQAGQSSKSGDEQTTAGGTAAAAPPARRHKSLASWWAMGLAAVMVLGTAVAGYWLLWRGTSAVAQPEIKSLAVLPFKSLNREANDDYLGLGIADSIIMKISQIGELTVRPTSAVRKFANQEIDSLDAAQQLKVDSILDGMLQRAGDRLRVSVNLLRVKDGASLWTESFDLNQNDIFAIQDSVSREIATRLRLKLSPAEQARLSKHYTTNAEAYEYYLKGRTSSEQFTTSIGDIQPAKAAIGYFKKAVELDPTYALAYAGLANAYMWMANFNDPDNPAWVGLAQQALAEAESLDSQLGEIHTVRFEYYFSKYGSWDLIQAARESRQAVALNPSVGHYTLGTLYDHAGFEEGSRELQRALEIDPTNTGTQGRLVESYELVGKLDEAIEACRRFFGQPGPALSLIWKNRLDEAQSLLEKSVERSPGDLRARSALALISALRGRFQEAEAKIPAILKESRNNRSYHHITYNIASVYALEGKTDEAVRWLRTTAETGMPNYPLFARDPHLDRIRKEPAVIQFMTALKARWESYRGELGI
jgi:serine/threonine protein kinase/Flp pilus assembly protein TadD